MSIQQIAMIRADDAADVSETGTAPGGFGELLRSYRQSAALAAPDRAAVRAFFEAATGIGAEVLHEPRLWPEYHASYYGAFVRDPDGNNVEAVCHAPE